MVERAPRTGPPTAFTECATYRVMPVKLLAPGAGRGGWVAVLYIHG